MIGYLGGISYRGEISIATGVILWVVFSAALHVVWNAGVKRSCEPRISITALSIGEVPFALVVIVLFPIPDPSGWLFIVAGVVLHVIYSLFLLLSYEAGDFSQAYPIARGASSLFIVLISALFLGIEYTLINSLSVLLIVAGIFGLSLSNGLFVLRKVIVYPVATGLIIALYSLVDGFGAQITGSTFGYLGWVVIGNALILSLLSEVFQRGTLMRITTSEKTTLFFGGGASFASYTIVVWAFTKEPIALVSALREISVIFSLIIGSLLFEEKLTFLRVASVLTTFLGVALLIFC